MTKHYADAEVDAVHKFAWENRDQLRGSGSARAAMGLLDEIAPAIAARALREVASLIDTSDPEGDEWCTDDLRRMADEIERGE